jgi:hypothetical protein
MYLVLFYVRVYFVVLCIIVLFHVLFVSIVLFYVLFVCKCVLYYFHLVSTQLQLTDRSNTYNYLENFSAYRKIYGKWSEYFSSFCAAYPKPCTHQSIRNKFSVTLCREMSIKALVNVYVKCRSCCLTFTAIGAARGIQVKVYSFKFHEYSFKSFWVLETDRHGAVNRCNCASYQWAKTRGNTHNLVCSGLLIICADIRLC